MIITDIIAKSLAFVDAILGFFATTAPAPVNAGVPGCPGLPLVNVTLTDCGEGMAGAIVGLMSVGLAALNAMLAGLLAV